MKRNEVLLYGASALIGVFILAKMIVPIMILGAIWLYVHHVKP